MQVTRFLLAASLLLVAFSAVMMALLYPLLWIPIALGAVYLFRKHRGGLSAFGTARWADVRDVQRMFNGDGLLLGEFSNTASRFEAVKGLFDPSLPSDLACEQINTKIGKPLDQLLRLNTAVHTAVFAPTGVGKGISCVIPFLLTCRDSCVVVDFKGENATLTAEARRKMGQEVVILDPFMLVRKSPDTFNVIDGIWAGDPRALDACRSLAAAIVTREQEKGDGVHFLDNAEAAIAALIALIVHCDKPDARSLQMVSELASRPDNWTEAVNLMANSPAWDGMLARMGGSLMHLKERELASTLSTINRFLRFLNTPTIAASTRESTFDPANLRKKKMTVYLVIPPTDSRTQSPLLRLWITSLLNAVIGAGLQERTKVHFVLDEAASLGHMDVLDDAVDKYRGYGVRLQLYYQSLGQLKKCWPDGQDQTLLSNVSQVYFGINDMETAKLVSERLGKETIIVTSGGESTSTQTSHQSGASGGSASRSTTRGSNSNWQQSPRELLQPNEVMALDARVAITFTPGVPPIWTRLVRYFEPGFASRTRSSSLAPKGFLTALILFVLTCAVAAGSAVVLHEKQSPEGSWSESFPEGGWYDPSLK